MTAHRAQTALAGWLAAFAGYAAVVTAIAQGPESAWEHGRPEDTGSGPWPRCAPAGRPCRCWPACPVP